MPFSVRFPENIVDELGDEVDEELEGEIELGEEVGHRTRVDAEEFDGTRRTEAEMGQVEMDVEGGQDGEYDAGEREWDSIGSETELRDTRWEETNEGGRQEKETEDEGGSDNKSETTCHGVPLKWEIGPVLRTFPWQLFDEENTYDFHIAALRQHGTQIWMRSNRCLHERNTKTACANCLQIPESRTLANMTRRAESTDKMQYKDLTYEQAIQRLRERRAVLEVERTKVCRYISTIWSNADK